MPFTSQLTFNDLKKHFTTTIVTRFKSSQKK